MLTITDPEASVSLKFPKCVILKLIVIPLNFNPQPTVPAAAFIILLSHTCGRWTFAPMERLVVVYHFVISIVEGEGVLLVSFSHADFLSWNHSDLVCWKKGARYEISCGDPSEKSLLCCRNWTKIYPGKRWWDLVRKCKLKFILLMKKMYTNTWLDKNYKAIHGDKSYFQVQQSLIAHSVVKNSALILQKEALVPGLNRLFTLNTHSLIHGTSLLMLSA